MKLFTDAEKQQLQAKIGAEQERRRALRRSKSIISTALSSKYGFLVFIICLLILSVLSLPKWRNYDSHTFLSPMVMLMLLFNHIAYHFTKKGWINRVMKTIAWSWIVFVWAYMLWIFWTKVG